MPLELDRTAIEDALVAIGGLGDEIEVADILWSYFRDRYDLDDDDYDYDEFVEERDSE